MKIVLLVLISSAILSFSATVLAAVTCHCHCWADQVSGDPNDGATPGKVNVYNRKNLPDVDSTGRDILSAKEQAANLCATPAPEGGLVWKVHYRCDDNCNDLSNGESHEQAPSDKITEKQKHEG